MIRIPEQLADAVEEDDYPERLTWLAALPGVIEEFASDSTDGGSAAGSVHSARKAGRMFPRAWHLPEIRQLRVFSPRPTAR